MKNSFTLGVFDMARLPQTMKYHMCSDGTVFTDLDEAFVHQDCLDHQRFIDSKGKDMSHVPLLHSDDMKFWLV